MITTTGKTIEEGKEYGIDQLKHPSTKSKIAAALFTALLSMVSMPKVTLAELRVGQKAVSTSSQVLPSNQVAVLPPAEQKVEQPKLSLADRLKASTEKDRAETAANKAEIAANKAEIARNQKRIETGNEGRRAFGIVKKAILENSRIINDSEERKIVRNAILMMINYGPDIYDPDAIDGFKIFVRVVLENEIITQTESSAVLKRLENDNQIQVGSLPTK